MPLYLQYIDLKSYRNQLEWSHYSTDVFAIAYHIMIFRKNSENREIDITDILMDNFPILKWLRTTTDYLILN